MSRLSLIQPHPAERFIEIEDWYRFGRDYRAQFKFARILQEDYLAAVTLYFEKGQAQPEGRAMVRCFGSFLDGVTGTMRHIASATCQLFRQPLNPFLQEKAEGRNITTHQRVFTTYRLLGEFLPGSPMAKTHDQLWDDLHKAIEIRNRIAHPKSARDLEVTSVEGMLVADVGEQFCQHLNQFLQWLLRKEQKLLSPHLVECRRLYRKIGRNEQCPCKSGRKYKACCGLADIAA